MPLVEGNFTGDARVPMGSTYSFSHNQNTGTDRCLVVIIAAPAVSITSVNYGGQALTNVRQTLLNNYSTYWSVWRLNNPPTGINSIQVNLSTASWNPTSVVCYSFTGSAGVGLNSLTQPAVSNPTATINISNNSMIIGANVGGNSTSAYIAIPQGTNRPIDWTHGINNYTWGGISPSLSAGNTTIQGGSTATSVILGVEVKEAAAPVGNNTSGWWMILN
jgi:hypothetical protein